MVIAKVLSQVKAVTQKARGVQALQAAGLPTPGLIGVLNKNSTPEQIQSMISNAFPYGGWSSATLFARPCPMRPRHGFVDSRRVKTIPEIQQVIKETLEVEPDGEVILMKFMPATFSGIATPSLLTIGDSYDGATMGKDTTNFPLTGVDDTIKKLGPHVGVGKDEDPYVELVYDTVHENYGIVQLRAGPKMTTLDPDFIPTETKVANIIRAGGDLLEWEAAILKATPGTVVYHPGGSLADHYYVHARSANIPVLTTREPIMGEVLPATAGIRVLDPGLVVKGIVAGFQQTNLQHHPNRGSDYEGHSFAAAGSMVLQTLHNSAALSGPDSWWLGYGVATALRLGFMALKGEERHFQGNRYGGYRASVYSKHRNDGVAAIAGGLADNYTVFRYGNWGGGFGGVAWATCAMSLFKLFDAMLKMVKTPTVANSGELLRALNTLVNQEHNGGWWFNKFIVQDAMDYIQKHQVNWLTMFLPAARLADRTYKALTEKQLVLAIEEIQGLNATLNLELDTPELSYLPFTGTILTHVRGGPVGSYGRGVPLPIENMAPKSVGAILYNAGLLKAKIENGNLLVTTPDNVVIKDDDLELL